MTAGKKTSVYLTADLATAVENDGRPLAAIIRAGLVASGTLPAPVDAPTLRRILREELRTLATSPVTSANQG